MGLLRAYERKVVEEVEQRKVAEQRVKEETEERQKKAEELKVVKLEAEELRKKLAIFQALDPNQNSSSPTSGRTDLIPPPPLIPSGFITGGGLSSSKRHASNDNPNESKRFKPD